jgi:tetratricopeptide (TPR) repeat protein
VERQNPDYGRAIAEYKKALELDPKHEPTLYYLAIANLRNGNRAEALRILSTLTEINPSSELVARLKKNLDEK